MSTRFTQRGTPMVESRSLRLVFGTAGVRDRLAEYVAQVLKRRGYEEVTPSMLNFLGTLDCGVNFGSDIARRLKVSRQMVAKTVKELCRLGYLEQVRGVGRRKEILFTARGERLMADVRRLLARLDEALLEEIGREALDGTVSTLETIHELLGTRLHGRR